jgi:hypothetical protein
MKPDYIVVGPYHAIEFPTDSADVTKLRKEVEANPTDFTLRMALVDALYECGNDTEAGHQKVRIQIDQMYLDITNSFGLPQAVYWGKL